MSRKLRVLIVDDEAGIRESLRQVLKADYDCAVAGNAEQALVQFQAHSPDLVLLDVRMPDIGGLELLDELRKRVPEVLVIMISAVSALPTVVDAMRRGAEDYLTKPFEVDEVRLVVEKALEKTQLRRELARLRYEVSERYGYHNLIGRSQAMRSVYELIARVAERSTTILVRGESGTGKELVAKAIHYNGPRRKAPFVSVNCAAIPDTLFESEMFGHEKGAFTDAHQRKRGHFEQADGGTLFLDEVGELSALAQTKLLRAIQEREILPVGASSTLKVDARLIAATNQSLDQAVADGSFRQDLYYRLNVVTIALPPLRERLEDLPLLVAHLLQRHSSHGQLPELDAEAMRALHSHDWPGNVRELENTLERAIALAGSPRLGVEDLRRAIQPMDEVAGLRSRVLAGDVDFDHAVQEFEIQLLRQALDRTGWVQVRAARLLGLSRRVLKYKMDKYGLSRPDAESPA